MDVAPLFQPDVPGRANMGKLCDLFSAQAWRSPAQAGRQSDLSGRKMRSALAQKIGKGQPPFVLIHSKSEFDRCSRL
jgi:hypothetical protein